MSDILSIIEKYQQDGVSVLDHPDLAQDITFLQNYMPKANNDEEKQIKDFMASLLPTVEQEVLKLEKELATKSDSIDLIRKNSEACLAYNNNKGQKG